MTSIGRLIIVGFRSRNAIFLLVSGFSGRLG